MKHYVMKAYNKAITHEDFRYPIIAQRKYDGIRVAMQQDAGDDFRTAQGKKIPNKAVRQWLTELAVVARPYRLDGELIIKYKGFHDIQSEIMSEDQPMPQDLKLVVFDITNLEDTYINRLLKLAGYIVKCKNYAREHITLPEHYTYCLHSSEDFRKFLEYKPIPPSWEGLMIKWIHMPYKFGRSTLKEGYMFKWCEYIRDEARVISFNVQEDWSQVTRMGSFTVEHPKFGRFDIGSGLNNDQKELYWEQRGTLIGQRITFKYKLFGTKDKPRSPIFVGFRYD